MDANIHRGTLRNWLAPMTSLRCEETRILYTNHCGFYIPFPWDRKWGHPACHLRTLAVLLNPSLHQHIGRIAGSRPLDSNFLGKKPLYDFRSIFLIVWYHSPNSVIPSQMGMKQGHQKFAVHCCCPTAPCLAPCSFLIEGSTPV